MTNNFDTCVIFAAGEYYGETPIVPAGSFVIAADGGLDHARALDVMPDVVVGDFDSITGKRPTPDERTVELPPEKTIRICYPPSKSDGFTVRGFSISTARSEGESTIRYPTSN